VTVYARIVEDVDAERRVQHVEDPDHPGWCICKLAGMYELGVWVCPRSWVREPVPPVSLTRGGFVLGH
jgi:hypothetical protein